MFIPLHDQNPFVRIRLQFVTLVLIFINIAIWLLMSGQQLGDFIEARSAFYTFGFIPAVARDVAELPPELVLVPESANYVTYAFFHTGFMHLAGNMLFLWVFGDNVEDSTGHLRFLVFYILCAIAGAFAHQFAVPNSEIPLVGASGAAAGVVGAYLVLHPKVKLWVLLLGRIPLRVSAFWVLGAWVAFQVYSFVFNSGSDVSWAAHIGGFMAGISLIIVFKRRDMPLFDANLSAKNNHERPSYASRKGTPTAGRNQQWGRGD